MSVAVKTTGPKNISLRQIREYAKCPRLYALSRGFGVTTTKPRDIRTLPATVGISVHEGAAAIFRYLKQRERPDIDKIADRAVQRVKEQVEWSRSGRYVDHPESPVLQEVLLGNGIDDAVLEEALANTEQLVRNAARTRIADLAFADLKKSENERVVEILEVEKLRSFKIEIDGVEITTWLKCDLVARNHVRGTTVIVDWKTGKRVDNDIEQAKLYGLYLHTRYGVEEPQIRIIHLRGDGWAEPWRLTITPDDLRNTREWLANEYRRLRKAWQSAEQETGDARSLEAWPQIPLGSSACSYCEFAGPENCDRR